MTADLLLFTGKLLALAAGAGLLAAVGAGPNDFPPVSALKPQAQMPDPLVMLDSSRVASREQWEKERRPELTRLFQYYMCGTFPPPPGNTRGTLAREDRHALGGKATLREVTLRYGPQGTPPLHLMLLIPNARKGPAPTFLGIAFCGNHAVVNDPMVRIPDAWMYPG